MTTCFFFPVRYIKRMMRKLIGRACVWGWILVLGAAATGCATHRIDWNARVGTYTYDQAVLEFGPPDKEATLSDDRRVADWLVRRGSPGGYASFYGPIFPPPYRSWGFYGPAYYGYYDSGLPEVWIRLTFDKDGCLVGWERLTR
jgi:hypothetical protein